MKRHLTYIVFGTILILGHFVFSGNRYVYASDVPSIALVPIGMGIMTST